MATIRPFNGIHPQIADGVFLAETAVIIGDVVIDAGASIWYGAVLRGDVGPIRIGAGSNVQDCSCLHMTGEVGGTIVGKDVTIGHSVTLHSATIEDGCLIGMGSTLLDGCHIGARSLVAAGSLVTPRTRVEPGTFVRGAPAKPVRPLTDEELTLGAKGAADYRELMAKYQ